MLDVFVAGESCIVDAGDGVVGVWGADTLELTLVHAIDGDFLEDGVGGDSSEKSEREGKSWKFMAG